MPEQPRGVPTPPLAFGPGVTGETPPRSHLETHRVAVPDAVLERRGRSRTKRLRLLGAEGYTEPAESAGEAAHLAGRYGSEAALVESLYDADPALRQPLVPGLPYLAAEAVHSARHEMATTLDDVLARRTRARLLARDASIAAAPAVAALVAPELGWDEDTQAAQVRAYVDAASAERDAAGLTAPLDAAFGV